MIDELKKKVNNKNTNHVRRDGNPDRQLWKAVRSIPNGLTNSEESDKELESNVATVTASQSSGQVGSFVLCSSLSTTVCW